MQTKTSFYKQTIENALEIAKDYLLPSALEQAIKEKESIMTDLSNENSIKVPLVGGFNSGKSTLINTFIGKNLLPTDINPLTAISYEMYYSQFEKVELYRDNQKVDEKPLANINDFSVKPGDVAKVFVADEAIKTLQDNGVILVDMPGLDSGIEAHNEAIFKYIDKGSAFVLLVPAAKGTIPESSLAFIRELGKYNLKPAVLISKADQKPESELAQVKELISALACQSIGSDVFVGCTSSATNEINDLSKFLDSLDCDSIIADKFYSRVSGYINLLIMSLKTQIDVANQDIKDIDAKIQQLEKEKQRAKDSINNNNADSPEKSTNDILEAIAVELSNEAENIAKLIVKREEPKVVNNAILAVIRPALIKALKEEGEQYANELNTVVDSVSKEIANVVNVDIDKFEDVYNKFGLPYLLQVIPSLLMKLPHPIAKVLGVLLTILLQKLPDIIRHFFGQSEEALLEKITAKIKDEIISTIISSLRDDVRKLVVDQQNRIKATYIDNIDNNITNVQQSLSNSAENSDKEQLKNRISTISDIISQLESLKANL